MRRTLLLGTVAAASIALLAACNKSPETTPAAPSPTAETTPAPGSNSETVSAVQDAVSGAVGTVTAATTTSTQGFVEAAAIGDMYEIEASRIALQRSQRADVKAYAQQMIDAHTGTSQKLQATLASAQINVTVPTALDDRRKGMLDNLNGASDTDFDGRFIDQQETAHSEAATLFKTYAENGDNTELKQFASNTVPAIEQHGKLADQLDKADDNQGSSAPTQ